MSRFCGRCHECGTKLLYVLDGEEYCPTCRCYRRYRSHGWARDVADTRASACPEWEGKDETASRHRTWSD